MMIVQFVMECLCYLFLPIAISLFAFDSTKGLAIRYVQQTLAILAWPIGFAVVDLVGYSLLTSGTSVVSAGALAAGLATGFTPAKLVIGGIVAVWLILGSLVTPIVMQMLFCSGTPMSSAVGHAIQMGLGFPSQRVGDNFNTGVQSAILDAKGKTLPTQTFSPVATKSTENRYLSKLLWMVQ
jgi:hypothetical protein